MTARVKCVRLHLEQQEPQTPHSCLSVSLGAAVFSPVLPCVHRPLCALESHQLSAHPLEGGAGEVEEHRIQYAVEVQ